MKKKEILSLHESVERLIATGHLYMALTRIVTVAKEEGAWDVADATTEKLNNYDYLIEYFRAGAEDPTREELRRTLTDDAFALNDRLADWLLVKMEEDFSLLYHIEQYKVNQLAEEMETPHLLQTLQTRLSAHDMSDNPRAKDEIAADEWMEQIFNAIWTNFPYTDNDLLITRQLITTECVRLYRRELFIAALTLALLQCFDTRKMSLLLDCLDSAQPERVRVRAWTGLALIAIVHARRIGHDRDLRDRLATLRQAYVKDDGSSPLLSILLLIYQSQEAEAVKQRIEDEISPELRRLSEDMRRQRAAQSDPDKYSIDALNPEWSERIAQSNLADIFQEINDLQQEGTDIMLNSFLGMSRLSFFETLSNWFLPYDVHHSIVAKSIKRSSDIRTLALLLEQLPHLCSSDKYALFLTLKKLPASQRNALFEMIHLQFDDIGEEQLLASPHKESPKMLLRSYLHDLYRFFSYHPRHEDFVNPFRADIHLFCSTVVGDWFAHPATLRLLAKYFFRKRRYEDAVAAFRMLRTAGEADESDLQQLAYAADHQSAPDDALTEEALAECRRLYPSKSWTLHYLAAFLIQRKRLAEAWTVLQEAMQAFPDEQKFLVVAAQCLMKLHRHAEALPLLFKADIQKEGNPSVEQSIAWCSLIIGNLQQAENYAIKATQHRNVAQNWLNAGHVALRRGDIAEAIDRYLHCLHTDEKWDIEDYFRHMDKDLEDLSNVGFNTEALTMVEEAVAKEYFTLPDFEH